MKLIEALCLDDLLLIPQYSDILSRKDVDLSSNLDKHRKYNLSFPIISSPMDTISESKMSMAMDKVGGLTIVHRYNTIKEQVKIVNSLFYNKLIGVAVGVTGDYMNRVKALYEEGVDIICLDIAHGNHILMERAIKEIRNKDFCKYGSDIHIMAGNVATADAFENLERWGADSIRVGIGGGSICSTKINTGHGIPTVKSLIDCVQVAKKAKVILDGGCKNAGDVVKCLALGADFVMVGSLLAGTDECPVSKIKRNGKWVKEYRGMASKEARQGNGKNYSIEGISTYVPYRGSVIQILKELEENIKSGLSYSGARNIKELQQKAKFIRQTTLGQRESDTHILFRK